MSRWWYPFGDSMKPRLASAGAQRPVLLLGAYPSAVHVEWTPPLGSGLRRVRAIPVADEPTPFWDGTDAEAHVAAWRTRRKIGDRHGTFRLPRDLNGSSGRWVDERVLEPLGVARDAVWITDCLDTYRLSDGARRALEQTYSRLPDVPAFSLPGHPSETQVVNEADRVRLERELGTCQPELVVTLGNAAARVLAGLVGHPFRRLDPDRYGQRLAISVGERAAEWLPLAHPGAPTVWHARHEGWMRH